MELKKYMLRRRKDNTIADQLPKKVDNIVFCQLTDFQLRAYKCPPPPPPLSSWPPPLGGDLPFSPRLCIFSDAQALM